MALGITLSGDWLQNVGSRQQAVASIAFDSSYPTGGEALTPAQLGLAQVDSVVIPPVAGYQFAYDYTNQKVLVYYADYDAVADGPLIEVPDTTDLSALTGVKVIATGY